MTEPKQQYPYAWAKVAEERNAYLVNYLCFFVADQATADQIMDELWQSVIDKGGKWAAMARPKLWKDKKNV